MVDSGYLVYKVDGVVTGVSADLFYSIYTGQEVNSGYKMIVSGSVDGKKYSVIETKVYDDAKHASYAKGGAVESNQSPKIAVNKSSKYRFVKIALTSAVKNATGTPATAFVIDKLHIDYIAD